MKRRDFVAGGTKCALARPGAPRSRETGPRAGDVAIADDRIAAIGRVSVAGGTEIDARDMADAVGLPTGLEYTPGSFATRDELVELAEERLLRG